MCETLTKKEMIYWIVENQNCSNKDIPDWMLELSRPIDGDPKFRNRKFRELLQITYTKSRACNTGMGSIELEGFDHFFEWYSSRVLHFLDVERQRRKAPYFEFTVEDVFSADEDVNVYYDKCQNGPISFSTAEILSPIKKWDDDDDDEWDYPLDFDEENDVEEETPRIIVNNKYDNEALFKRFGDTIKGHRMHTRFMINTTGVMSEYYFKTKYDRLQDFIKSLSGGLEDIHQSMSFYFDRRVLLPKSGRNILSVYIKHRGADSDTIERKFDDISGFMDDCIGRDLLPPNGNTEFIGYYAPTKKQLYIIKDL